MYLVTDKNKFTSLLIQIYFIITVTDIKCTDLIPSGPENLCVGRMKGVLCVINTAIGNPDS